ncbi:hypothetical protein Pmani_025242 [Petrolisthes manimaculis]|uniref:Secreted protein n=1 Tax=Petrolisthes manimaculis TaxID=1843537 RepID=A0AAE1TXU2_9EUCA|nr:hypothetical protein Pmani_025242 [Petrolisthes manimaculis]
MRKGRGAREKITVLLILHNILETASNPTCNELDKGVTLRPGLVQWSRDEGSRWRQPGGDKRDCGPVFVSRVAQPECRTTDGADNHVAASPSATVAEVRDRHSR